MPFTGMKPRYQNDLSFVTAILNSPYPVRGFNSAQQREVVSKLSARQKEFSDAQVWDFWERLWQDGKSFEEKNLAVYFWINPKNYALAKTFSKELMGWAKELNCWAHSDGLSSLYAKFLEDMGAPIDRMLQRWNSSSQTWERRQSVVSLLYYTRLRKKTPSASRVLKSIKPLLNDDDHYVQKGVGWTLREIYQVDPVATMKFIEANLHKIKPTAYSAAVEKAPPAKKAKLRKLRRGT